MIRWRVPVPALDSVSRVTRSVAPGRNTPISSDRKPSGR